MRVATIALTVVLAASACGGSNPNPAGPTPTPIPTPAPAPAPTFPNMAGTWRGTYTTTACDASGDWAGACPSNTPGSGQGFPVTLTLQQSDETLTGTMALGTARGPIAGTVAQDGTFTLAGSFSIEVVLGDGSRVPGTQTVGAFQGRLTDPQTLGARWADSAVGSGLSGNLYRENVADRLVKTTLTLPIDTPIVAGNSQ